MATNELWLVDPDSGERVLLAESGADGWVVVGPDDLGERLTELFELHFADVHAANRTGTPTTLIIQAEVRQGRKVRGSS